MISDPKVLLAARQRSRQSNVDLGEGKSVTITRPPENDMPKLLHIDGETRTWLVGLEQVHQYVVGWDGFTEEDILGKGVGSTDAVAFDKALWYDICSDHVEWIGKVASAILDAVVVHIEKRETVAKNSPPA